MNKLFCGNCGNDNRFFIYTDNQDNPSLIIIKCAECNSKTTIEPQLSKMVIGWGKDSEGILSFIYPQESD